MEFDLETLSPTYRLTIGLPGGSQAFAIAERLGLDPAIVEDARSRLSENQRAFEETLARIRETEGETSDLLERARAAEARAAAALRVADDERRQARRERDEAVRKARIEAEQLVAALREEIRATRESLERETVTQPSLDAAVARAEAQLARLPDGSEVAEAEAAPAAPHEWRLGEKARSRSGGWEGRIAALEKDGTRATLESGSMRISVATDDLDPVFEAAPPPDADRTIGGNARFKAAGPRDKGTGIAALRLDLASTVASSLDLRGARVEEALDALDRYLDDAGLAGLDQVVVIHGLGTGALRDAVRAQAGGHPLVTTTRPGERGEGGDGATIIKL